MATTEAGRRLVAAGHGVAVLPDGMVRTFEATMGLRGVPLADEWGRRRHRLVLREEAGLPAPARRLLDTFAAGIGPVAECCRTANAALANQHFTSIVPPGSFAATAMLVA